MSAFEYVPKMFEDGTVERGTHFQILQLFRRISAGGKFDPVRVRSNGESMSGLELFEHGRKGMEAC
jgi:hypothetical protein